MTRIITTDFERRALIRQIETHSLPMAVAIEKGGKRSDRQNRLNRQWMREIAEQTDGWDAEDARAFCKLHHGVPILRNEDEDFRTKYDRIIRPMPYETKIELMKVPFDFPVTRLMKVNQEHRYLNAVALDFSGRGVVLTDPSAYGLGDLLRAA